MNIPLKWIASFTAVLTLTACATTPRDRGIEDVERLISERGLPAISRNQERINVLTREKLAMPLTIESAIQIGMMNNQKVTAEYAKLGLAAADVFDAGRLSNPTLSASVLFDTATGASTKTGLGLVQRITELITLPARTRLAQDEYEQVQLVIGHVLMTLAHDIEAAYIELIGAQQILKMREQILRAAQASADLAQRFYEAGNISRLKWDSERFAASESLLNVQRSRTHLIGRRDALNRLMGLRSDASSWTLAADLSAIPTADPSLEHLYRVAEINRMDWAAARKETHRLEDALGVVRTTRYLGDITLGAEYERDGGVDQLGPALELEIPLFNQGQGRLLRKESELQRARAHLRLLDIEIQNGIQRAWSELRQARAQVEHFKSTVLPLSESMVARTQEEVNFMLKGPFELLKVKQTEYDAYQGYLEALRDYWLSHARLNREAGVIHYDLISDNPRPVEEPKQPDVDPHQGHH